MQRKTHTRNRAYMQTMHILVFVNNKEFLLCKLRAIDCEGDDVVPPKLGVDVAMDISQSDISSCLIESILAVDYTKHLSESLMWRHTDAWCFDEKAPVLASLSSFHMVATCWRRLRKHLALRPWCFGGIVVFLLLHGKSRKLAPLVFSADWFSGCLQGIPLTFPSMVSARSPYNKRLTGKNEQQSSLGSPVHSRIHPRGSFRSGSRMRLLVLRLYTLSRMRNWMEFLQWAPR